MKTTRRLAVPVAAAALLTSAPAHGALFTIDLGDPPVGVAYTTPPEDEPGWAYWLGNDVFGAQPGCVGAQLRFTGVAGQRYRFTFEFVGGPHRRDGATPSSTWKTHRIGSPQA